MKELPLGTENFKEIIENNSYYVDKTKAIELIEKYSTNRKVILFTRPRRFGKTLFISTVDYFYNIENNKKNKELFNGLYIANSECISKQGKYPVINISLKDISGNNFAEMLNSLRNNFSSIIEKIDTFNDLTSESKRAFNNIKNVCKSDMELAIKTFTKIFYQHYNKKVILLIDEYEAPLLNSLEKGFQGEALDFFKSFFSSALKSNEYLEKGILTGITKISQSSIFSGLNNFIVYDYNSSDFNDTFGFTQDEVNTALRYYNLDANFESIKKYYDGYRFGNLDIYNPWSILNYLSTKELTSYWTKTGSTKIIIDMLKSSSDRNKEIYKKLLLGKEVFLPNVNPSNLLLDDLKKPDKVFDFMLSSGYLNYNNKTCFARIVNKEVLYSMPDITSEALFNNPTYFNQLKILL